MLRNTALSVALGMTLIASVVFSGSAQVVAAGPAESNLIANPSVEIASTSSPSLPEGWQSGVAFGSEVPTYTYPATDTPASEISSGAAVRVSFASYAATSTITGGDAKWIFDPVPVVAGAQYVFKDAYVTDAATTQIEAVYYDANHAVLSYDPGTNGWAGYLPAGASWQTASDTFTAPIGAAYMSVLHLLQSKGTLTTDSYSLVQASAPEPFANGFVTLTFDDGYRNHDIDGANAAGDLSARSILHSAGLNGTFYIISHVSGFGLRNPSFEAGSANAPTGWLKSGSSTAAFAYPVAGHTGKAAQVSSVGADSDAAWYFAPVTSFSDENYTYSDWYKSTAASEIYVQIQTASSTLYIDAAGDAVNDRTPFVSLPASADWTQYVTPATPDGGHGFYVPPEAQTVTVIHSLKGAGSLAIDDVSFGAYTDFMDPAQVLDLQANGDELGGHTETHADLTAVPQATADEEITGGRQDLLAGSASPVLSLAYPYGDFNSAIEGFAHDAGYTSARTVNPGFNAKNGDKLGLLGESVDADTTVAQVETWVQQAEANHLWLILIFHQIESDAAASSTNLSYGSTPSTLQAIVNYLKSSNVPVMTMSQGVALMDGGTTPTGPTTPTTTPAVPPVIRISSSASTSTPTNHDITVTATTSAGTLNAASHVFSQNGSFDFVAADGANGTTTLTVAISNIDKTAPTAVISYSTTTATTSPVIATASSSEPVTYSNAGGAQHSFAENGSFTFAFTDAAGNQGTAVAMVSNISAAIQPTAPDAPSGGSTVGSSDGGGLAVSFVGNGGGGGGGGSFMVSSGSGAFTMDLLGFNAMMVQWGQTGSNLSADLNRDGRVDILDFNLLMVGWH